jgi:deoxyribonuclease-4
MRLCAENSRITLGPGMLVRYTKSLFVCVPSPLSLDLRIGIHTSTAGSLERSAVKAHELGANTFQIFTSSPRMWRAKPPDPTQVQLLKRERERHDLTPLVVHDSYLINLASADPVIRKRSIEAFTGEIERALIIGAEYLVTHPGNYKDSTLEQGLFNVAEGLAMSWRAVDSALQPGAKLMILLENTAGARNQLGADFSELATLRSLAGPYLEIPIGYCLDTCHCYVSGRDISTAIGLATFVRESDDSLGLDHVPVIHANDAKTALGSHLDRHAHIGAGYIGKEGFRRILSHPRLRDKAFILETPVDEPGDDLRNVTALKELVPFPNKRLTTKESRANGMSGGRTTRRST